LWRLSERRGEGRLVRVDEAHREVPVAGGAQQEVAPARRAGADDNHAGQPLAGHHPESRSRSVLVRISWTSRTLGPLNISRAGRLACASAKSALFVHATKSSKVRHQVFTS